MVGGIETIIMELAQRLAVTPESVPNGGVHVTVVTPQVAGVSGEVNLPFRIIRNPSFAHLISLIWHSDILHIAGSDMRPLLLGWLLRKRVVVEHHGFPNCLSQWTTHL